MIINEKQIMKLMTYTSCLISKMVLGNAPIESIKEVHSLIEEINNQQSEELKVVE